MYLIEIFSAKRLIFSKEITGKIKMEILHLIEEDTPL